MSALVTVALTNAVMALGLAVLAWASTLLRRPTLTHALWLLVLLRLLAPPLWHVPFFAALPVTPTPVMAAAGTVPVAALDWVEPGEWVEDDGVAPIALPVAGNELIEPAAEPAMTVPAGAAVLSAPWPWEHILFAVWTAGATFVAGLAAVRIARFLRILRSATPAPAAWQRTSDRLAHRLGLRRGPTVWLVASPMSPLLWAGLGRPRLMLPAGLVGELGAVERAAILAHELAHLRRGDQWVRWLELLVSVSYWWFPLVGLARRGLREAGEQCCDAWVVWALPKARRAYATALVDTVDFLSDARPALPPLASGVGEVRNLRRRIVMIMRASARPRLTRLGLSAALGVGILFLALTPGRADGPDDDDEKKAKVRAKESERERARGERERERERAKDAAPRDEVERARAEIRELREALQRAERRLSEMEGRPRSGAPRSPRDGEGPKGAPGRAPDAPTPPAPPGAPGAPGGPPRGGFAGGGGAGFGGGFPGGGGFGGGFGRGDGPPAERRMMEIERQLEALRRELSEMRREMRRDSAPGNRGRGGPADAGPGDGPRPPRPPAPPDQPERPRTPEPTRRA